MDDPFTLDVDQQPELLIPDDHYAAVEISERHDPYAFWRTGPGLRVYGEFRTRIVAAAKPTEAGAKFKEIPLFRLGRDATGKQLKNAHPNAIWTATDFCPWLATKLAKHADHKAAEFFTNGWYELFLVEGVGGKVFIVTVHRMEYPGYAVGAWQLDDKFERRSHFGLHN